MKLLGSVILLLFFPFLTVGANWVRFQGGIGNDGSGGVVLTASGDLIHCNWFSGAIQVNSQNYTSSGGTDILISKTNAAGQYLWVSKIGGIGDERGLTVTTDNGDNVFIGGYFSSTLTVGSASITSAGGQDAFVMKLDPSGNLIWIKSGGGLFNDATTGVTVDASGNVFCTGNFTGNASFDALSLVSTQDPTNSFFTQDVFIVNINATGNYQWVRKGGSKYPDQGIGITHDLNGDIYVTGQFSDTIQFVNLHPNTINSAIFLVKYSSAGNEVWFNYAGGGGFSNVRGITTNGSTAIYLAGECSGSIQFFGTPVVVSSNAYPNRVFVARYNLNGNPEWVKSDGSTSPVSSGAIDLDNTGNIYMTGLFRCVFNEYADQYGQGVFNSVGFNDVFVSKYDSTGNRIWSRHAGGPAEDEVNGIAINDVDTPVVSGSFSKRFVIPAGLVFQNYGPLPGFLQPATAPFFLNCGDNRYGNFVQGISAGGRDVFFGKVIDISRLPYDYYKRTVSTCSPGQLSGCVSIVISDNNCQDQVTPGCGGIFLNAVTNTSSTSSAVSTNSPGPDFTYLWSTGSVNRSYPVNASGTYTVTMTSADGCFSSTDSMSVIINNFPSQPTITDSKNININAFPTIPIDFCAPDSITLTATNVPPGVNVFWQYNSVTTQGPSRTIYGVTALNVPAIVRYITAAGCTTSTSVLLRIDSGTLDTINPYLLVSDSVNSCSAPVQVRVADSLNPQPCSIQDLVSVNWNITPFVLAIPQSCPFNQFVTISPAVSGNYTIEATILRFKCGVFDSVTITKTVYIQAGSPPVVNGSVTGAPITELCPGDSLQFTASGGTSYLWSNGSSNPTITVTQGSLNYCVTISVDSNGCVGTQQICRQVDDPVAPVIVSGITPSIICPGDSVLLNVTSPGVSFDWFGPGIASAVNDTLYGVQPGIYYCNVTNSNGCTLISNLLELVQYSTPYIFASPSTVFCSGDTVTLSVQSAGNAFPVWDFPLSGNATTQSVQQPGTYSCSISSCGITTIDSVLLTAIQVSAFIPQADTAICFGDSLVLTPLPFTGSALWFPDSSISNTLTVTTGNSYYMQVTDPNGCTAFTNIVIVDVDTIRPPASILSTTPLCEGDQLTISPVLIPGENALWTGPNGFSSSVSDIFIDSVLVNQSGYYVVIVTNGQCFSDPDSVFIQIDERVPDYILTSTPLCANETVSITASPLPGFTFSWIDPSGNSSTNTSSQILNYSASQSGYYKLSVANGVCPAYLDSIFLGLPANGSISITSTDPVACDGDTVFVDAVATPGNLSWYPAGSSQTLNVTSSTQVYCTLTDTAGCVYYSDSIGVSFNLPPVISSITDLLVCEGDQVVFNVNVTAGTIQQLDYSWTGPSGFSSNQLNPVINSAVAADDGQYVLIVSDSVCTGIIDSLNLEVNVAPSLPTLTAVLPLCPGDELMLIALAGPGASPGFIYPTGQTLNNDSLFILNTTDADTGIYVYFAETAACPVATGSILVNFDSCRVTAMDWVIPNIFSPNEDGINELFLPMMPVGEDGILKIYNRWGDSLYEGKITEGWNGRDDGGNTQPAGVYYWIMIPFNSASTLSERNGFLELVK
jgi:hypothetical protein